MRLAWFAAILFVAIFGAGEFARWIGESIQGPNWWAEDFVVYDAARRLVTGAALYADPKYLYTPLASLVGVPFLILDRFGASIVYALAKLIMAIACVLWLTPGWRPGYRVLAIVGLVASLPFLHDLFLGNTNVLVVAAMVPAVFGRSRRRNGILLGLAAAAFAKPLMIPVMLWLLVWRRETFVGAVISGVLGTAVGVLVFRIGAYGDWVTAVRDASAWLSTPFAGNHGISAVAPALWLPVAAVVAVGLVLVLVKRGRDTALVWAVTSGVLLATYAGTYGALPIALAIPAFLVSQPLVAIAIVAASPIGTTLPLPLYAAAIMVAALAFREAPRGSAAEAGPADQAGLAGNSASS
jgi:hypothetical protein